MANETLSVEELGTAKEALSLELVRNYKLKVHAEVLRAILPVLLVMYKRITYKPSI